MIDVFPTEAWFLLAVIIGLLCLRILEPAWKAPATKPVNPSEFQHYEGVTSLFASKAEYAFFQTLNRHLPEGYFLLTKVRLEDIIRVKNSIKDNKLRWRLRGRVKSRHVDFVIMDLSGKPRIIIELDGPHHRQKSAKNADELKDGLFRTANIAFLRVKTGENFQTRAIELVKILESS